LAVLRIDYVATADSLNSDAAFRAPAGFGTLNADQTDPEFSLLTASDSGPGYY
jgi:hypothetical protein